MYPSPFGYSAPTTLEDALSMLAKHGDAAKVLAGGHSLLPLMKLRLAAPRHLVDLRRVASLVGIDSAGDTVRIGAMTTYAALAGSAELRRALPMLANAMLCIGDPQVRNRGTIGGSLVHADPAADLPAIMLATDAVLTVVGPNGTRQIAAADFFLDAFRTAIGAREVLTAITIPATTPGMGGVYVKRRHPASRFALIGVAAVVTLADGGRTIKRARLAVTGIGKKAARARSAEASLLEGAPSIGSIHGAALLAADDIQPRVDLQGDVAYKRNLTAVFTERALNEAIRLATR